MDVGEMTISLAAVFIPIVFMGGIVGRLLYEFAVTIIIAILISGMVSVTLTPMLCARMLKNEHGENHNALYRWSETSFNKMQDAYDRTLTWSLNHRRTILGMFFASLAASVVLMSVMKQDFLPADDSGRIQGNIQAANGTSFEQMAKYVKDVTDIIAADPDITGVLASMDGSNGAAGTNSARMMMITLREQSVRESTPEQVIARLRPKLSRIPGVNVFLTNPPTIRLGARGSRSNYQYTLQGLDQELLQEYSARLMADLRARPGFVDITSDYESAMPSVQVEIDRDRAAAFGVSAMQIQQALGSAFGGQRISQINTSSNQYEVIMELLPEYQRDAASLDRVYVTGAGNQLVPADEVTALYLLADAWENAGNLEQAVRLSSEALALAQQKLPATDTTRLNALIVRANVLGRHGDRIEAVRLLRDGIQSLRRIPHRSPFQQQQLKTLITTLQSME